jgi:hypothetical protein
MNDEIDLTNKMRQLAAALPREANPEIAQRLAIAFHARQPRRSAIWLYAAAAVLLLSVTLLTKDKPPTPASDIYNAADFIALPYSQSGVPLESAVVIRVQMRPAELSSMGVAVPATASTAKFNADILVGQDGVARAVRLIQ